jgi:uncharacterized protein YlxP (DUF503 family)
MVVGVCRLVLELPEFDSLKQKRGVVRKLLDRVRSRFNVSAAEVEFLDEHRRAMLGFAVISNDGRHANTMLDKIVDFCERAGLAEIGSIHVELVPMGRPVGDLMQDPSDFPMPESWKTGSERGSS